MKNAIEYEIREIISKEEINVYKIRPPHWNLELIETQHFLFEDEYVSVDFAILDHKTDSIAYLFREKDSVTFNEYGLEFKKGKWISELKKAFENNDSEKEIEIEGTVYKASDLFHFLTRNKGYKLGVIMDHAVCEDNYEKIKQFSEKRIWCTSKHSTKMKIRNLRRSTITVLLLHPEKS